MALIIHNKAFQKGVLPLSADDVLTDSVLRNKTDDFILIVPTGRLNRYLNHKTIEEYYRRNNKPCGKLNIFNIESFAEQCFKLINPDAGYRLLSATYRLALTEEAVQNAELEFYDTKGKNINYHVLERLANIIYGLREDGISREKMFEELSNPGYEQLGIKDRKKFSDIARILLEYENLLEDKYLDPPALLNLLIKISDEYFFANPQVNTTIFDNILNLNGEVRQILVYGFSEFKVPEVAFLSKFASSNIPLSIHLDFSEINGPLFGNLSDMKSTLLTAGFDFFYTDDENIAKDVEPESELTTDPKFFLRRWLFNVERDIKYNGLNENIKIFEFENPENEVRQICKLIKHLVVDSGYKPSDIAVVSRDTGKYSPLFRAMFSLESIPADFSDRYALAESQLIITLISILDTIANGYRRNDVFKTLESKFVNIENESGQTIDHSNLLQVASELRFSKNNYAVRKDFWIKRITNMIEYLEKLLGELDEITGNSVDKKNLNDKLKSYKRALIDFTAFSDMLPDAKKLYSPDEFKNLIAKEIIGKFNFYESIKKMYNDLEAKYSAKRGYQYDVEIEKVERFSRAISELLRITDEMTYILKERSNKKYPLTELINKLKIAVAAGKYQTRERQNYGVTVTAIEQIRHIPFAVTILCGLNDGIFPMPYKPESFLGKELKDSEQIHLQSEQIQFYQFLINGDEFFSKNEKRIYLTYTKKQERYEATRSSFIDSLLKVTDLQESVNIFSISSVGSSSDFAEKLPWLGAVSNRPELAEVFGTEKYNNRKLNGKLFKNQYFQNDISNNLKNYIDKFFDKLENDKITGNFRLIDGVSQNRLDGMQNNIYSATDFETYASCSFKYFAKKMLRMQEIAEDDVLFSSLEFGNIIHNALYKFYLKLQELSNEVWLRPEPDGNYKLPLLKAVNILKHDKRTLFLLLTEIIEKEFQDIRLDHPLVQAVKREILGFDDNIGWAEQFIDSEIERAINFGSHPVLFELEFGAFRGGEGIPHIELKNGINLRGKIDRIELTADSGYEPKYKNSMFTTVDYKSTNSGTSSNNDLKKGKSFQMTLYSLAIEKILRDYYGIDAELKGSAYYIIKSKFKNGIKDSTKIVLMPEENAPDILKKSARLKSIEEQRDILDSSISSARNIVDSISNAEFKAEPLSLNECQYCTYQPICRINERAILNNENDEDGEVQVD